MPSTRSFVGDSAFGFANRLPDFIEDSTRRQLSEPAILRSDQEVQAALRNTTQRGAEMLVQGVRSPSVGTSEQRAHGAPFARVAARHDVPLTVVLQCYRLSHAAAVDQLLAHAIETQAPMALVRDAMRNIFHFVDGLVEIGTRVYALERQRINARPGRIKYQRIKTVLEGATTLDLSYPLDGWHIAVALQSPQPEATIDAIQTLLPRAPLLASNAPDGRVLVWVGSRDAAPVFAALQSIGPNLISAGMSGPELGVDGFRSSNRKAKIAFELGARIARSVTTFADVALEALALGEEQLAKEFVLAEMGELSSPDSRTTAIRQTVCAYFAWGAAPAAAEQLNVSTRTVVYRLRHAERILGRPLTVRRAELETAIRLHRLLALTSAQRTDGRTEGAS